MFVWSYKYYTHTHTHMHTYTPSPSTNLAGYDVEDVRVESFHVGSSCVLRYWESERKSSIANPHLQHKVKKVL